jgi:hypothetical protein
MRMETKGEVARRSSCNRPRLIDAHQVRLARNVRTDVRDEPERAIERKKNQKRRNHIAIAWVRLHHDIGKLIRIVIIGLALVRCRLALERRRPRVDEYRIRDGSPRCGATICQW